MNAEVPGTLTDNVVLLRSQLRSQRTKIDALLEQLDSFMGEPISGEIKQEAPGPSKKRAPAQRIAIIDAAIEIMRDSGAMKTPALLKMLKEKGISVNGKRPIQTLYGILHKNCKSENPKVNRTDNGRWYISGLSQ